MEGLKQGSIKLLLALIRDGRFIVATAAVVLSTLFWVLSKSISSTNTRSSSQTWNLRKCFPPGPRPWPLVGNLPHLGSLPHQSLARLSRKYGPLMYLRLGSIPTFIVSSPEMAKEFLKVNDRIFASRPRLISADIMGYNSQNFGFLPHGEQWRSMRKIFTNHLITRSRMDEPSLKAIRWEEIDRMMKTVLEESQRSGDKSGSVTLFTQFFQMTTNIIARMAFGTPLFGALNSTTTFDTEKFQRDIEEVVRLFGAFNISDFIPSLRKFDLQGFEKQMRVAHKELDALWQEILDLRKDDIRQGRRVTANEDFLDLLLSCLLESTGEPMTDDQIKAMLLDVLLAGTDTTAITLEWAMTELMRNPEVLKRAQQELDDVVRTESTGSTQEGMEWDFQRLDYLHAVVKETLRLHPAGALLVPHESVEDCVVDGYVIPARSRVIINVWAIGRNPEFWDRASEFRPERFLEDEGRCKLDVVDLTFKFLPFGSGRRSCPGAPLALRVVEHALAVLLHTCQWDVPRNAEGVPNTEALDMSEEFMLGVSKLKKLEAVPTLRLREH